MSSPALAADASVWPLAVVLSVLILAVAWIITTAMKSQRGIR